MAYAGLAAVLSRAGRLAKAFTEDSEPGVAEIEVFLRQEAAEIDALLSGRGFSVPATGRAAAALEGLNADRALLLALVGAFPGESAPAAAQEMIAAVRSRVEAATERLVDGKHPAAILLSATEAEGGSSVSSLWQEEPNYDMTIPSTTELLNPSLRPTIGRESKF